MTRHPLVLYYHGFGDRTAERDPHNLFVPASSLVTQLDRLARGGWQPLTLAAYLAGWERRRWPRRSFLLTIDDGFVSTLEVAAPILHARAVPAVLFVPPARLGGVSGWMPLMPAEPILDEDGIRALDAYGVEVGVHGMDHADVAGLDAVELRRQVVDSRELLSSVTGQTPRVFAYPSGRFDADAVAAVRMAGYEAAFATEHHEVDRWLVPRVGVNATDTPRTFALKLTRTWPRAQRLLDRVPRVRSTAHRLIGSARR